MPISPQDIPVVVSSKNSSVIVPTTSSPFIGATEDILQFTSLTITLATAQSGTATGTLIFEFSSDGINWDISVNEEYNSSVSFIPRALRTVNRYFRLRYIPYDSNLTAFRLTTLLNRIPSEDITRILGQSISVSDPVKLMGSVALAQSVSNTNQFVKLTSTTGGASNSLDVALNDGYGRPLTSAIGTPSGTESALIVRNIPSGTQVISGTITGITNVVHVDDNSSTLSIDDGSGSITVDGSVAATQSGTWTVQPGNTPNTVPWLASIHDGSTKATVRDLASNDALNVAIVDGSGNQITTFGGGTQYTEGDTDSTITGTAVMWEDTSDTLRAVSAAKPLPVNIVSGSSSGVQYVEDDAAAANPTGTAPILIRQDTPATLTTTDGDNVAQRATNYGAAYVQIVSSAGSFVDSFGGGTQYVEDAAAAANPTGTTPILVRQDTPSTLTTTDGDNIAQRATNYGAAYVQVLSSSGSFVDTFGGGTQFADGAARGSATGTLAMVDDGTNIQSVKGTTDGYLVISGAGTAGLPAGGVVTVQGVAGGVAQPASQSGTWNVGTVTTITNVVHVDDNSSTLSIDDGAGSITVDNAGTFAVQATQSGTWTVRNQDGYGNALSSGSGTPGGTENALIVRNIPSGTQTISGTVTANAGSGTFTVGDGGGSITVDNPILSVVGGGTEATAQRVTIATDSTGVLSVDDNGGSLTVDGAVAATQSGTWSVRIQDGYGLVLTGLSGTPSGTETALVTRNIPSGTQTVTGSVNVGTVTTVTNVVHVDDNAGSITVDNPVLSVIGGGTEATAQRVTIATDSTGVLSVDDNGSTLSIDDGAGSITVDGSVAATQSGTWSVRIQDGYGLVLTGLSGAPSGTETALVTRNIPSGTQTVSGTVSIASNSSVNISQIVGSTTATVASGVQRIGLADGYNLGLRALVSDPSSTETGLVTRNIPSGTQAVSGSVNVGTLTTITNVVHVDDNSSSLTVDNPVLSVVGGGTEATAQRVTIASDSTGVLSVDDNGGSLTVDGSVAATQSGTWSVRIQDGYGLVLTGLSGAPSGTETALVTRNIPSGTQAVSGTVSITANSSVNVSQIAGATTATVASGVQRVGLADGYNLGLRALVSDPGSTETGLVVRNIPSGTQTVSGSVNVGTLTTITNVVHVDDNSSTLSIDDGAGSITVDNPVLSVVGGGTEATAQRVTIASDSTGVLSVDDNGGSLTVDGSVSAVQSGTWSVRIQDGYGLVLTGLSGTPSGTETALVTRNIPSGTQTVTGSVNVGTVTTITNVVHVDDNSSTLSIDDGAGSITIDNSTLAVVGGGTEATALRVTVASDSTGVLSVDDNGGSLTVDGTVTANQGGAPWSSNLTQVAGSSVLTALSGLQKVAITDGYGLVLTGLSGTPAGTETGLVVRNIPSGTQTISGTVSISSPSTATRTSVASSATVVTILASNTSRKSFSIFNESTKILYLAFGAAASLTSYTVQIGVNGYYEANTVSYTGILTGLWIAVNGSARVTEVT